MIISKFVKHIKMVHPLLILGMCLLITLASTVFVHRTVHNRHQERLAQLSEIISNSILARIARYENSLTHIYAYLKTHPNMNRETFQSYVKHLKVNQNYPGIQGLGYTIRIRRENLAAYEERVRKEGFPDFKVWPEHQRDDYFSIHFLEPFDWRNKRAFGFDMYSQAYRQNAMSKARDSAKASLTESVTLVQETSKKTQPGFLIYLPLYEGSEIPETIEERREKLQGFVYAPFRAFDFFNEIFVNEIATHSEVRVEVYDGKSVSTEGLIYSNDLLFPNLDEERTSLSYKSIINPSDHYWTIVTTFRPNFTLTLEQTTPWFIALIGTVLSFLLFWIFHAARSHALAIEASLTRFNALVANLTEGLIFAHPNGDIQLMNKVALKIYELDEIVSKRSEYNKLFSFKTLTGEDIEMDERPIGRTLKGKKYSDYELEFIHLASNKKRYLSYGGTPIFNKSGKIVLVVLTVRDITYKKQIEIELREALSARDEFVSISSHELKTPLTSLKLKAQLFRRKIEKNDKPITTEEIKKFAEDTDKQISRLNRLVEDMLDVSRIRSGKFSLEKSSVDICQLIQSVVDQIKLQFIAAGSSEPIIEHCDDVVGHWDMLRVEQVINNLLTNAIRYGEGKPVTLNAKSYGDKVCIYVKDQGAGISKDKQEKIFHRFERLEEVSETSGLGLGLFLSQKIVVAHGGRIWVESEEGKGACFIVELPLSHEDPE